MWNRGAVAGTVAGRVNVPAVEFDEMSCDGQAKPETAMLPCRSIVTLAEAVECAAAARSDAASRIADLDEQPVLRDPAAHVHLTPVGELDRVRDHVAENLQPLDRPARWAGRPASRA